MKANKDRELENCLLYDNSYSVNLGSIVSTTLAYLVMYLARSSASEFKSTPLPYDINRRKHFTLK